MWKLSQWAPISPTSQGHTLCSYVAVNPHPPSRGHGLGPCTFRPNCSKYYLRTLNLFWAQNCKMLPIAANIKMKNIKSANWISTIFPSLLTVIVQGWRSYNPNTGREQGYFSWSTLYLVSKFSRLLDLSLFFTNFPERIVPLPDPTSWWFHAHFFDYLPHQSNWQSLRARICVPLPSPFENPGNTLVPHSDSETGP